MAIRPGGTEGALEDKLMIFARFESVFVEESGEGGEFAGGENRFHGARIRAAADEGAIGAFAEDEIQRADDDRFASACLAGDGVVARREFQGEVGHQREIFDAERREHGIIKTDCASSIKRAALLAREYSDSTWVSSPGMSLALVISFT